VFDDVAGFVAVLAVLDAVAGLAAALDVLVALLVVVLPPVNALDVVADLAAVPVEFDAVVVFTAELVVVGGLETEAVEPPAGV
jgi:phage tail protein X